MFACEICDRKFFYKNSVNRHFRREHINKESRRRLKCTECDHECRFYHDLRTHMYMDHGIVCKVVRRAFSDFEEFKNWKRKFEETTHYMYVKHSSSKVSMTTHERKTYFVCHRTGTFQSGSCGKRKLKRQGSNKINASCPSTMEVVESLSDGSVKLVLWKTHVGHDAEVARTFLSATERNWLAARISEGTSYQKIMNEIQNLGSKGGRMCYIKSQDIRNMRKNLINTRNRVILSDIRLWVKNIQKLNTCDDHSVIFFKDRNSVDERQTLSSKDVMLIIMTPFQESAFKSLDLRIISLDTSPQDDNYEYHLITLYAANGYAWCPFIYCVTTVIDTTSIQYFLTRVKEKLGDIRCSILLCDNTPPFYEAWCNIMSKPEYHFLHLWYIEKHWLQNTSKIKGNDTVRSMIFRTMKLLLTEQSELAFEKRLNTLRDSLKSNERLTDFFTFFTTEYLSQILSWGGCYRRTAGLRFSCEIGLHKLHNKLCSEYHSKLIAKDLNGGLNALLMISNNCEPVSRRIREITVRKNTDRQVRLQSAHRRGVCIRRTQIGETTTTQYKINYKTEMGGRSEAYDIRYLGPKPCNCILKCEICTVCIHNYSCTCVDYAANLNVCEHIHACAIVRNKINVDLSAETDAPLDSFVEEVICEEEIVCNVDPTVEDVVCDEDESDMDDDDDFYLGDGSVSSALSDVKSDDYQTLIDMEENSKTCEEFMLDASVLKGSDEELNLDSTSTIYYEPFTFVSDTDIDHYSPNELQTSEDALQIVAFHKDGEYEEAVLVKDDDCSSFVDASSVYEDGLPTKTAIIALGFSEEGADNYIFRKFDNTIIKRKRDTLFTLTDFDNVEESEINKQLTAQMNSIENPDFHNCFDSYDATDENILGL